MLERLRDTPGTPRNDDPVRRIREPFKRWCAEHLYGMSGIMHGFLVSGRLNALALSFCNATLIFCMVKNRIAAPPQIFSIWDK